MAVEILLPKVGPSTEQAQVVGWLVRDGERVTEGGPLFTLQADTSTSTVEAPGTGTLKITASTGQTYEVGTVLGYIE